LYSRCIPLVLVLHFITLHLKHTAFFWIPVNTYVQPPSGATSRGKQLEAACLLSTHRTHLEHVVSVRTIGRIGCDPRKSRVLANQVTTYKKHYSAAVTHHASISPGQLIQTCAVGVCYLPHANLNRYNNPRINFRSARTIGGTKKVRNRLLRIPSGITIA
jgi:hypothetical protein